MSNPFENANPGLTGVHPNGADVTPSGADVDLDPPARGLWVGGAGTLVIVTPRGDTLDFGDVPAATYLPFGAVQIKNSGTSATKIIAGE